MKIFLIAGKSGSGKSTVAKIIKDYYEEKKQKTIITEYSKYLKIYAKEMLGWNGDDQKKPREFLQEMGSYIRQNLGMPNLFIERMATDFKIYSKFIDTIVISDVRLPEEIDFMKERYPHTYAILVEKETPSNSLTPKEAAHITEHALDNYNNFDYIISNSDENLLKDKVLEILSELD